MDNLNNIITLDVYSEDEEPSTSRQRHESSESHSSTPPSPSPRGSLSPGRTVTFANSTPSTPTSLNAMQAQPRPENLPWSGARVTLTRRLTPSNSVRPLPRPARQQSPIPPRPQVNEFHPRALNALNYFSQSGNPPTSRAPSQAAVPRPVVGTCACSHSRDTLLAPKAAREKDHPITSTLPTQLMTFLFTTILWLVLYLLTRSK